MQFMTDGKEKYIWFTITGREQLFDLENDPQSFAGYLWRVFAGCAAPHCGDILDGPQRHDDELARLHMVAFRHEVVVWRRQPQRHEDRHGLGRGARHRQL